MTERELDKKRLKYLEKENRKLLQLILKGDFEISEDTPKEKYLIDRVKDLENRLDILENKLDLNERYGK